MTGVERAPGRNARPKGKEEHSASTAAWLWVLRTVDECSRMCEGLRWEGAKGDLAGFTGPPVTGSTCRAGKCVKPGSYEATTGKDGSTTSDKVQVTRCRERPVHDSRCNCPMNTSHLERSEDESDRGLPCAERRR